MDNNTKDEKDPSGSIVSPYQPFQVKKTSVLDTSTTPPTPVVLVIDNFYNNPDDTRNFILTQEFKIRGNYPGQRTVCFATEEIRDIIQTYITPFGGKITQFPLEKTDKN